MSDAATLAAPPPARIRRRFVVPLLAVGVPVLVWAALYAIYRFEVVPEAIMPLTIASQFAVLLGGIVLAVWFLGFSGAPVWLRIATVVVVVGVVGGFAAAVRKIEFDGMMNPMVSFIWDPDPNARLAEHLATAAPAVDPPDIAVSPADSPQYRGPAGDGQTVGVGLADAWPAGGPKVVWRHPVGGGHAGIAVAGNSAVTLEQRGDEEVLVCYARDTGRERWAVAYPARFDHTESMGGDGPRTTPAVAGGDVYSLGATGELLCVDGATGQPRWRKNVIADCGAKVAEWGLSASPLVWGDRVIVTPGVDPAKNTGQAVAAYDRSTGDKVWAHGAHPAAYASPMRAVLGGVEQIVIFDADGLGGHSPDDGAELWRHPWVSTMGMSSAQPLVVGPSRLFVSSEKANGCAVLEVTRGADGTWAVREVWHNRVMAIRFANPVLVGGHVYGLTDGRLVCVDAVTGTRLWKDGDYGAGQVVAAGPMLVVTAEGGDVALVAADPGGFEELERTELFTDRTWNVPALAGGQLFVRNHREMAVLELP